MFDYTPRRVERLLLIYKISQCIYKSHILDEIKEAVASDVFIFFSEKWRQLLITTAGFRRSKIAEEHEQVVNLPCSKDVFRLPQNIDIYILFFFQFVRIVYVHYKSTTLIYEHPRLYFT